MKKRIFTFQLILSLFVINGTVNGQLTVNEKEEYSKTINQLYSNEEWEKGKQIADEGLKKYPNNSDLHMLLGKYYYEKNNYDKARFELQEALKHNKNNTDAKQILVNVEIASERFSSAICYVNELLEINPYWKGLWLKKIDIYRMQNNQEEANRLLKRLSQIFPEDVEISSAYMYYIEEEAINKRKSGDISEAINLTKTLIDKNAENENYYFEIINNFLKNGDYKNALIYADRGLFYLPNSILLINKKADILAEQKRYSEALELLQLKMKDPQNQQQLKRKYNLLLSDAARHQHMADPYMLYWKVFEGNPHNNEAFVYIINTAINKALFEDAFRAINLARKAQGETKNILLKERDIYFSLGLRQKADEITCLLFNKYTDDADIRDEYIMFRYNQAKTHMNNEQYNKAEKDFHFVAHNGDNELKKSAILSIFNCNYLQGNLNRAGHIIDSLIILYPDEWQWYAHKADICSKQRKYFEALYQYEQMLQFVPLEEKDKALLGYDELATGCVKSLLEEYRLNDALRMTEHWLTVYPNSDIAHHYAINIAAQLKDFDKMNNHAQNGRNHHPANIHYLIKHAESHDMQNNHEEAITILKSEINNNPYHRELINAHSQASENYANQLIKTEEYTESLNVLNNALTYDPDNKSLKYFKGLAYEKLHQYDSAHYYQSFYEPAPYEVDELKKHLKYLKSRTYRNEFAISTQAYRHADVDAISSVFGIGYTRLNTKNTYNIQVNYSGRQNGQGIQVLAEWSHQWTPSFYSRINAAGANKYFPAFMANVALYKTFKSEWEIELGGGYRYMNDDADNKLGNVVAGISKTFEPCMLSFRFNSVILNSDWLYSLSGQARFFLNNPRNYITAMGSFGSAPDIDIIDNQLYDGFDITNVMCGLGIYHQLSDKATLGLLGTWYNYENTTYNFDEDNGKNRNLYNLQLQLYVNF